ncbi:MAG: DEAD/DEAH box helicase [Herpetosiphon sp.]
MSTHVLHGNWLPEIRRFFVWGETDAGGRKGRQPKIPPHPFQTTEQALREQFMRLDVDPGALVEHTQTLWLPSAGKLPMASPELMATGAVNGPEGDQMLMPWRVTGLALTAGKALDLLLALRPNMVIAADMLAWRAGAFLALQLVAAQQMQPALERDGYVLRAGWRARPDPAMAHQIATLARCLPPVCRAAVDDPAAAAGPRTLVDGFLAALADATIRETGFKVEQAATPGGHWLRALVGPDANVKLKGAQADDLFKSWQAWDGQRQVAGDDVFRVTFRLEAPQEADAAWRLAFLLQATDDPSLLVPAGLVWQERGSIFTYLDRRFEQPHERLLTALGYAARLFPALDASLHEAAPDHAKLAVGEAFTFLKEAAPLLEQSGFGVLVPAWFTGRGARLQARAHAKASSSPNARSKLGLDTLVDFHWEMTLAGQRINRDEFERLVALKSPLVQVRGQWVVLDPAQMQKALAFFEQQSGDMDVADALRMGLGGDGQAVPEGVEVAGIDAEGWLSDMLADLADVQRLAVLPAPRGLHGELRPYQLRGFSWMAFLRRYGLGACLADDMGMGKTIQTIALLLHEREELNTTAPALLVSPTSVVGNWLRELQRFAPGLRVMLQRGAERLQGSAFVAAALEHDVVLTSYALLQRDRDVLQQISWSTMVLDEAQNIKNAAAKQSQAARALPAGNKVALTGTPVENRLTELWSIMAFLNPGYLGSETAFKRTFARPIERTGDPQARERLRRLTTPFVLRRLKTDPTIIADLPNKLEMKVYCSLSKEQATLYQAVVQEALMQIGEAEAAGNALGRRGQVLAMLMKLKQICNHPAQFLHDGSAVSGRSGKLQRLEEMLEEVYAEDDRALIFTQFSELGTMMQRHLQERLYDDVLFLHGGTAAKDRDAMVRRFQASGGPRVFILSLKAGGTGLNLTAANHVFHFDRWWNPAVENQATDRAFRIGQRRNVQVHKFICGGTLEDHIDELIESKRALAESVLGKDEGWLTELNTAQLRDLVALRKADVTEE